MQYDSLVRRYLQGFIDQRIARVLEPLRSFSRRIRTFNEEAGGRQATFQRTLDGYKTIGANLDLSDLDVEDYSSSADGVILQWNSTSRTFEPAALTQDHISGVRKRRLLTELLLDAIEGDDGISTLQSWSTPYASATGTIAGLSTGYTVTSDSTLERASASTTSFAHALEVKPSTTQIAVNFSETRQVQALMIVDPNSATYTYGSDGLDIDILFSDTAVTGGSPTWSAMSLTKVGTTEDGLDVAYGSREIATLGTMMYFRAVYRKSGTVPHFRIHGSALRVEG